MRMIQNEKEMTRRKGKMRDEGYGVMAGSGRGRVGEGVGLEFRGEEKRRAAADC